MSASRAAVPPPPSLDRRWQQIVVALFLVVIAAPGLVMLFGPDDNADGVAEENRELAAFPALGPDLASIRAFPAAFSRYFEDHFAFRSTFVKWQGEARLNALGVSPSADVLLGRDGWLFYADDGAMEDYTVEVPFTAPELETWRATLQDTQDWLERQGITYLFVLAPDKHVIYPEKMPAGITPLHDTSRLDTLVDYLARHSTVHVLDLRPALQAAKASERLYHLTDTHWNERGAFVGYQEIMKRLDAMHPGLAPLPREAFRSVAVRRAGLDLSRMLGLSAAMTEEDLRLDPIEPRCARSAEPAGQPLNPSQARVVTECDRPGLPRAVIFRDSFASALVPFLSEHFSRALYLWQRDVDPAVIREERPTVVIQEWVGRRLSTAMPYNAVPSRAASAGGGQ